MSCREAPRKPYFPPLPSTIMTRVASMPRTKNVSDAGFGAASARQRAKTALKRTKQMYPLDPNKLVTALQERKWVQNEDCMEYKYLQSLINPVAPFNVILY